MTRIAKKAQALLDSPEFRIGGGRKTVTLSVCCGEPVHFEYWGISHHPICCACNNVCDYNIQIESYREH